MVSWIMVDSWSDSEIFSEFWDKLKIVSSVRSRQTWAEITNIGKLFSKRHKVLQKMWTSISFNSIWLLIMENFC